ncbi:acyl-CoA N-acyltransferase [Mycena amicta]|nr:acyl-CoA N-acyltransferase [Mycena amicta]
MLSFRLAAPPDAPFLAELIRRAYRGQDGWTTEASMLNDERIDTKTVLAKIDNDAARVLVAMDAQLQIIGCCEIVHIDTRTKSAGYFGMFAVEPTLQAGGVGRQILQHAEQMAVELWAVKTMEMTVIAQREELIAYYERRGFKNTGEKRPFPVDQLINGVALRDDLYFTVLVKTM